MQYRILLLIVIILISIKQSSNLTLSGSETSYAQFPPWNACPNASFTFEFKTRQNEALLWYVDDGGTYDFVQVMISGGQVRMVMNIVDGRDGNVEIILGSNMNDGNWHKVTLVRRRMEVTFTVDNSTENRYSFGSDFEFGHFGDPGIVWAGGLPSDTSMQLARLSLPSAALQPRLAGELRNVIYGNCSCRMTRASYVEAVGANTIPLEACEVRNPCREGCVCISKDDGKTICDCSTLECVAGVVTHYELPMDRLIGTTLINPSGLDATAYGSPPLTPGIRGNSIELNGQDRYVRVSGPGHRHECFGDLSKCSHGYTLLFWSKFHPQQPTVFSTQTSPNEAERVFLSNGGHRDDGHGISGYFDSNRGQLKFVFKKKNGQQWRTTVPNVLPGNWHHIAATWNDKLGLSVYLDGELKESTTTSTTSRAGDSTNFNDFVIGRTNDAIPFRDQRRLSIDEFHFWNQHFNATDIREQGPFYSIKLPMNSVDGSEAEGGKIRMRGSPRIVSGKIDQAIHLSGRTGNYIEVEGDQKKFCTGNLTLCKYGLTMAGWVQFGEIPGQNGAAGRDVNIINSGGGTKVYLTSEGRLAAEARREDETWRAIDLDFIPQIDKWYYIETTWNENDGIDLYVDFKKLASSGKTTTREQVRRLIEPLMIGADSGGVPMTIDDVEIWYGDRKTLDEFKFIQRGRPIMHSIAMDNIENNKVQHPYLPIEISGRSKMDQGKIGSGLVLDGNNFASLGKQMESCLGNLDLCEHGMLMSAWIKPTRLDSGMDLLSTGSNGIKIRSIGNGKVKVSGRTTTHDWSLETDKIKTDQWQFIEVGWHPKTGLRLYQEEQLIASSDKPQNRVRTENDANPERDQFYIGRGDGSMSGSRYGQMIIDDIEYWHGNRDYLIAFNYIHRGKPDHIEIHMDAIEGQEVQHSDLTVSARNNPSVVPGRLNGAIRLDPSRDQYIELGGDNYGNCAGNLERCPHGVTTSMFLNIRSLQNGAYYYSNGGGMRMFGRDKNLIVAADMGGKKWEVPIKNLKLNQWYFVEHSWHPQKGLQVYVDDKLVGEQVQPTLGLTYGPGGKFLVGKASDLDRDPVPKKNADAIVDELQVWYQDRPNLIAFDRILRGDVPRVLFPLEHQQGNRVLHPTHQIILNNGASLIPAKVGNGAKMDGSGEYLSFGSVGDKCMGDLKKCRHGMYVSFFLKPNTLKENAYYLSSGAYSIFSKGGKIFARFEDYPKSWEVSTNVIKPGNWHKLELSWHPETGLKIYVDGVEKASSSEPDSKPMRPPAPLDLNLYAGRPTDDKRGGSYADAVIDEIEYWYADRDHLKAFGLIGDDINRIIVDMDQINGDVIAHQDHIIYAIDRPQVVPGIKNNGIRFDGNSQYADLGKTTWPCTFTETRDGRATVAALDGCSKGFTLRLKLKPDGKAKDGTYYVSSAPIDVYYRDGRLIAEARSVDGKMWTVSAPDGLQRHMWNQVDISWHPSDGLIMYINNEKVAESSDAKQAGTSYDSDKKLYIGRANTNMIREHFANIIVDDLQLWAAKRDYLIPNLINPDEDQKLISGGTTLRPPVSSFPFDPSKPGGEKKWLVFDGDTWIVYDFKKLPENYLHVNANETIRLRFKTDQPNGLIWYSGNDSAHSHISIKDGNLFFISNSSDGNFRDQDILRIISNNRMDDNQWHDVYINKFKDGGTNMVRIIVDGQATDKRLVSKVDFTTPNFVYLGGSGKTFHLTNKHIYQNFEGTVSDAVMNGNALPKELDLIHWALVKPPPNFVTIDGTLITITPTDVTTPEPSGPARGQVTFTTKQSYLMIPDRDRAGLESVEFIFRTTDPDGLILFVSPGNSTSLSVEMFDGNLYANLDLGRGIVKYPFLDEDEMKRINLNDANAHKVSLKRNGQNLELQIDDKKRTHRIVGSNGPRYLADGPMYVGGVDPQYSTPWHIWTRDNRFYRGCLWGLRTNGGDIIELKNYVAKDIIEGCIAPTPECLKAPCEVGICRNMWANYNCDCSDVNMSGRNCHKAAWISRFDGEDRIHIKYNPTRTAHTNDISIRFKSMSQDNLLFETSNRQNEDYLKALLHQGRIKIETNLPGNLETLYVGCDDAFDDNEWHTLHVKRRANYMEAYVDNCPTARTELRGSGYRLNIDDIYIGKSENSIPFVGHMTNVIIDNVNMHDVLGGGERVPGIFVDSTSNLTTREIDFAIYPLTFRQHPLSFVRLPSQPILAYPNASDLKLSFKTSDKNGIILYNDGSSPNLYLMLNLIQGVLQLVVADGSGGKRITTITNDKPSLADNQWHHVDIKRIARDKISMSLDNNPKAVVQIPPGNYAGFRGRLFIGGLPEELAKELQDGEYSGCIASFSIDGRSIDLLRESEESSDFVTSGCTDSRTFCREGLCKNFGTCIDVKNSYICDCNTTSFVGYVCDEEPEGYRYGLERGKGISIYRLLPPSDTVKEKLAFGFMTWQRNGTLVKVEGSNPNEFIEAKLENGNVAVYQDTGEGRTKILEARQTFNDGRYHQVYYEREKGKQTILRVDDLLPIQKSIASTTGTLNGMNLVKIGGNIDSNKNIIEAIDGIIGGVYLNGYRLIDEGLSGERSSTIRGDVITASHPFFVARSTDGSGITGSPPVYPPIDDHIGGGGGWMDTGGGEKIVLIPGDGAPVAGAVVGGSPGWLTGVEGGPRAAVAIGTALGILAAASSLMWALYKLKPGNIGGVLGSAKSGMMKITSPMKGAGYQPVAGSENIKLNNQSNLFSTGGKGAGDGSNSFSNLLGTNGELKRGNVIGVEFGSPTMNRGQQTDQNIYDVGTVDSNYFANYNKTPYDPMSQYQMQNMALNYSSMRNEDIFQYPPQSQNLMTGSELIRVDCVQLTNNGRYVVTGSVLGPPQVWDMRSGELIRIMQGEELSSTDLHLANGDSLLVGQIAEREPMDNETAPNRKLQIWDFDSGTAMEMRRNESCTASCLMSDGERMVLGRIERSGSPSTGLGTTVVVWDVLGNEPIRQIHCNESMGAPGDPVSYISLSRDNRFIVVGFQNSLDNSAGYLTFDLTIFDFHTHPPPSAVFDAQIDVTTILENQEAVTGTRRGQLIVWSIRTGKPLRHLLSLDGSPAHQAEVTCLTLSKDGQTLISGSADCSLKAWDLDEYKWLRTFAGHKDEVWCCTISNDNELVVSGSRDQTIRLWKLEDGVMIAAINAGLDIFKVLLSNNKKTVVALADKYGARKLIMLKVVRTKVRSSVGSRATSPLIISTETGFNNY